MARGSYSTAQQRCILEYLEEHSSEAVTAEQVYQALSASCKVGQTTVYRTLDRLAEKDLVIKVPSYEGRQARYRYVGTSSDPSFGRMVCLECGRTVPLECVHLEELVKHIGADHQFEVDTRHTVLYGYCSECRRIVK